MVDAAADLYALPLEEFTSARDDLARRLRAQGRRQDAERVRRLAKPALIAWALNQASRAEQPAVQRVLHASAALDAAQQELLARGAPAQRSFRAATQNERAAVSAVVDIAAAILQRAGHPAGQPTLDRLEATVRAAAADAAARDHLRLGTLTRELAPAGFGSLPASWTPPVQVPPAEPAAMADGPRQEEPHPSAASDDTRERLRRARDRVQRLREQLSHLREQVAATEQEAAAVRRARREAEAGVSAARDALTQAERALAQRSQLEQQTNDRLAALRRQVDDALERLAEAEDQVRS